MNSLIDGLAALARSAGRIALDARTRGLRRWTKDGNELVTSAELLVHRHVIDELARLLPGVHVLTEESEDHALPNGRFIVVDEIDGTVPYAAGADTWGVMIAVVDGSPECGVIHLPQKNVTIAAARGGGCRIDGRKITLAFDGALEHCIADAEINGSLQEPWWASVHGLASEARAVRCLACAAATVLDLLTGVTQVYLNPRGGRLWDFAPAALAIEESGGRVSAADGTPLRWDRLHMSFLACASARVADEVLAIVREPPTPGRAHA